MTTIRLGDLAPDFISESTFGTLRFYEWLGESWGILFSHPADFTPVCTTELGEAARLTSEFKKRNVKVLALSVDDLNSHRKWMEDIQETQGHAVDFPILADPKRKVASLYGMIHPNSTMNATVRSVFIVGPDKRIKLTLTYPASTGRNFDEILRVIDSLQLTENHSVATPVNWKNGDECVISPSIKQDEVAAKFPQGHRVVKPYLRYTPQPKNSDAVKS